MPPVSADLKQNLFYTLFFLITHNAFAIVCVVGIGISILLSIYKPTRSALCILLGFMVLLFAFEYSKHIVEPLRQQTLNSLITDKPHNTVSRIINFSLLKALPLTLPLLGFLLVGSGIAGFVIGKRNISLRQHKKGVQ